MPFTGLNYHFEKPLDNARRLLKLRNKIGLSQGEMASELGISRPALSCWQSGKNKIPPATLKLIALYEEYLDEDLALQRHEEVIRRLSIGWTKRLMSSFASGARKKRRLRIREGLERSLYRFGLHELSPFQVKRNLQVALINRMVDMAARSKGLPMKLVQALTLLNPSMEPEAREALDGILEFQAPMAPTLVAKILHNEFGASPSKLFAEWSPKPFATASIGQVHLARLKSGEKVAVKVQYPDIQKSIDKDFASLELFADLISVFQPDARMLVKNLHEAILLELDYFREQSFLQEFHQLFISSPNILVPKVYGNYCARHVLTMDYIEGRTLKEFKSAPFLERKAAAEAIADFMTITTFKKGLMNTDTHAGNFIFCPDGKVAFIDFGRATKVNIKNIDVLLKAVIEKNESAAHAILPALFPLKPGCKDSEFPFEDLWPFFLRQQAHLHGGEFRFTRNHIARVMQEGKECPTKKKLQLSIESVWSMATAAGAWNVFAELDAPVDFGQRSLKVLQRQDEIA